MSKKEVLNTLDNYKKSENGIGKYTDAITLAWHIINAHENNKEFNKADAMKNVNDFFASGL